MASFFFTLTNAYHTSIREEDRIYLEIQCETGPMNHHQGTHFARPQSKSYSNVIAFVISINPLIHGGFQAVDHITSFSGGAIVLEGWLF